MVNKKIGAAIAGFLLLVIFFTWKSEKERAIIGKWTADKLTECDVVVPIVTSLVDIEFKSNGKYIFNSTLNVHEEGKFKIKNDYLYTKDKLKENAAEKVVLIKHLKNDTLILEMNYKGKEQLLTLIKEKNESDSKPITDIDNKKETPNVAAQEATLGAGVAAASALAAESKSQVSAQVEEKKENVVIPPANTEKQVDNEGKKNNPKLEAYKLREAKRKERDAEIKRKEKEIYDAYMERVAKRKQEAAERKKNKKK